MTKKLELHLKKRRAKTIIIDLLSNFSLSENAQNLHQKLIFFFTINKGLCSDLTRPSVERRRSIKPESKEGFDKCMEPPLTPATGSGWIDVFLLFSDISWTERFMTRKIIDAVLHLHIITPKRRVCFYKFKTDYYLKAAEIKECFCKNIEKLNSQNPHSELQIFHPLSFFI